MKKNSTKISWDSFKKLLSIPDFASANHIPQEQVVKLISSGKLQTIEIAGAKFIKKNDSLPRTF